MRITYILTLQILLCIPAIAFSQHSCYKILSTDQSLTIRQQGKKKTLNAVTAHQIDLYNEDSILSSDGNANFVMQSCTSANKQKKIEAKFCLPKGLNVRVKDLFTFSFFRNSIPDQYSDIVKQLWDKFMRHNESTENYKKRELASSVVYGQDKLKHSIDDRNELRPVDSISLAQIAQSSKESGSRDSIVLFIREAIYFEIHAFPEWALSRYKAAYNYNLSHDQIALVMIIYRDYLLRTNRINAVDTSLIPTFPKQ